MDVEMEYKCKVDAEKKQNKAFAVLIAESVPH